MIMAVVAFSQASVSRHNPNYCYSEDPIRPQSTMHGSQSSYEAHRRSPIDPNASGKFNFLIFDSSGYNGYKLLQQLVLHQDFGL